MTTHALELDDVCLATVCGGLIDPPPVIPHVPPVSPSDVPPITDEQWRRWGIVPPGGFMTPEEQEAAIANLPPIHVPLYPHL